MCVDSKKKHTNSLIVRSLLFLLLPWLLSAAATSFLLLFAHSVRVLLFFFLLQPHSHSVDYIILPNNLRIVFIFSFIHSSFSPLLGLSLLQCERFGSQFKLLASVLTCIKSFLSPTLPLSLPLSLRSGCGPNDDAHI